MSDEPIEIGNVRLSITKDQNTSNWFVIIERPGTSPCQLVAASHEAAIYLRDTAARGIQDDQATHYNRACEICGHVEPWENYGDHTCSECGQIYIYDEAAQIDLTEAQRRLLRAAQLAKLKTNLTLEELRSILE